MAPTPSPRPAPTLHTPFKTPASKHRLQFGATPRNHQHPAAAAATEHPVEVIGRIRNLQDPRERPALEVSGDGTAVRVRPDGGGGCRDFTLDGVSFADEEGLECFYRRFVRSRIEGVRLGAKCTVMVYGPTGAGKSHTMFGCARQPGIVYRALRDILGDSDGEGGVGDGGDGGGDAGFGVGLFVQVAVLEIYNEEIYDLLAGNGGNGAAHKGNAPKVRLEVMGKKAKNATYISGYEAGKISREVAKVEKRRIVKSTLCNERSSRSHCMIILDVPSVGGRLMLVDMAGSENIEAAGQSGFEAKMQTAKINQGNTALKRVVESIANGDSHVPFRDSKLTMLLQDSFEDDKSKILMILCASPDPKELHKTISTLEYGAKAKCIIRAAHASTPKDKMSSEESSVMLNSKIVALNQFIYKLQMENKLKEKEHKEAQNVLRRKEEELEQLKVKLKLIEGRGAAAKEEEINSKVVEKTQVLRGELMKMEEKMLRQQQELDALKERLQEVEGGKGNASESVQQDVIGGRLMARLAEMSAGSDQSMVMSMELDMGDQPAMQDVREIKEDIRQQGLLSTRSATIPCSVAQDREIDAGMSSYQDRVVLSTVFEGDEEEEERDNMVEEVYKEVVEENSKLVDGNGQGLVENNDPAARKTRIQNIFRLCGNHRELAKHAIAPSSAKLEAFGDENREPSPWGDKVSLELRPVETVMCDVKVADSPTKKENSQFRPVDTAMCDVKVTESLAPLHLTPIASQPVEAIDQNKKNSIYGQMEGEGLLEVYIKWESGSLIKRLKLLPNSSLSDLRKLVEAHFEEVDSRQQFAFLLLGDPSGAPVAKEKEAAVQVSKLPICNNQQNSHLACLRVVKKAAADQLHHHIPFSPLESKLNSALDLPTAGQMSPGYLRELRI